MKIYYDTEFIEDGRTIDLISIGMTTEQECCEYYAVSSEFNFRKLAANPWLRENVWRGLPKLSGDARMYALASPVLPNWLLNRSKRLKLRADVRTFRSIFDWGHPDVKPRAQIAREVEEYITRHGSPQLWAWYGAYDHVAYAQLFGRMIDLPDGLPMFTCDLKQEAERLGNPRVPEQQAGQHNALADARHNLVIARFLEQADAETGGGR